MNALSCNYLVKSKLIFVLVLTAQASLIDHSWSQSDNPSNASDDSSPCFTWNPLITLLTTDKSTSVLNCICFNWNFLNEFFTHILLRCRATSWSPPPSCPRGWRCGARWPGRRSRTCRRRVSSGRWALWLLRGVSFCPGLTRWATLFRVIKVVGDTHF